MKNIHVLPTDKPSRLAFTKVETEDKIEYKLILQVDAKICNDGLFSGNRHIYITSSEEIKEGDWVIQINFEKTNTQLIQCITEFQVKLANDKNGSFTKNKIILTTDEDLDGVQAIDDEFLKWFVKNQTCEEVEVKQKQHFEPNKSKRINPLNGVYYSYKLIIPQEVKTSEEWQKQLPNTKVLDPDGWDRNNFQYSWFKEKITLAEYTTRLCKSTVKRVIPKEEINQEYNNLNYGGGFSEKDIKKVSERKHKQETDEMGKPLTYWGCLETPKQETLEEAMNRNGYHYPKSDDLWREGVMFGIKWQQERIPSIIEEYLETAFISDEQGYMNPKQWFEQFKKK